MLDFLDSKVKLYLLTGLISAFGALVNLLYQHSKGKKISFSLTIITIVIGFFVGNLVGSFIPMDFEYRDGLLMVAGFGCYPLLDMLESNLNNIFKNLFSKMKF
jgi:hypothetical protein